VPCRASRCPHACPRGFSREQSPPGPASFTKLPIQTAGVRRTIRRCSPLRGAVWGAGGTHQPMPSSGLSSRTRTMYRRQVSSFSEKLKSRILRPVAEGSTVWARQRAPGTPCTPGTPRTPSTLRHRFFRFPQALQGPTEPQGSCRSPRAARKRWSRFARGSTHPTPCQLYRRLTQK